jgi:uncharacterized damage-inducible protein DinB
MNQDTAIRDHAAKLLDWGDAHVTFEKAVAGIAPRLRGVVPPGLEHSAWQLLEHVRIAQEDILDFCRNAKYREKKWPDDYWPRSVAPKTAAAWKASIAAFKRDRRGLQQLAKNRTIDLFAKIPHGSGQTYMREILLIADHTAYHVGQVILVRRALGIWP